MEHIKVSSVSEAWRAAARIFPTDYEKNEENSKRAGYPIYETTSTDERFSGFHISDLNTRLEVNMGTPLMVDVPVYEMRENPDTGEQERVQVGTREVVNGERERLMIIQDRCMKQCRQGASDFGMTVSSRCRLVVPKAKETKPENKFAKYASS